MKKILLMIVFVMAIVAVKAQQLAPIVVSSNATLLQTDGNYLYYGNQVMNKKQCVDFLATRHQPAYETFQSGYKCYTAGWLLMGAGLTLDLAGSLVVAFMPEGGNDAMFYSGLTCLCLGAAAILASVPTVFIGYARLNKGVNMFNMSQAASIPQAYWTIQGSQNGIGLALHF
jgi:hypothetical protein